MKMKMGDYFSTVLVGFPQRPGLALRNTILEVLITYVYSAQWVMRGKEKIYQNLGSCDARGKLSLVAPIKFPRMAYIFF
jgi:hypothetical protein